jgi:hypothetical protein
LSSETEKEESQEEDCCTFKNEIYEKCEELMELKLKHSK